VGFSVSLILIYSLLQNKTNDYVLRSRCEQFDLVAIESIAYLYGWNAATFIVEEHSAAVVGSVRITHMIQYALHYT